jgi:predicted alpha/beta superfamily hydrolase
MKKFAVCLFILVSCIGYSQSNKTLKDSVFKKGDIIQVNYIDYGGSNRGGEHFLDSLKPVADFLKKHSELKVEIAVHTDSRGSDKGNIVLTDARARTANNTLINYFKIDSSRIKYKGYGETDLLISDAEIKKAKTKEEQNNLHAVNRRTELRVTDVSYYEKSSTPLTIGETRTIHSAILNENRALNIILPNNYDETKAYPVIYLLDGSVNEDLLHIGGLVQFYNMLGMPDCIVVGIANVDRRRDFTFHTDLEDLKKSYPTTGHSDQFIDFLETELQPYIKATYKTNGTNYIIGQSLGGLLATEILLKKPTLFTHYLIVSPSLWWDNESLLKQAKALLSKQPDKETYVYISVGGKEDPIMQKDGKELVDVLKAANKPKLKLDYVLLPEENHATILHQSISEAFKRLFPYKE